MQKSKKAELLDHRLRKLREFELRLAIQNPYDAKNSKNFLISAYRCQEDIIRLCDGCRPEAKKLVDAWFEQQPFRKNEGRGPRSPTGRSPNLMASILAATSRAPRRLQSRWSRAFLFIDYEHGNDLNKPKMEWILEEQGGLRRLARYAARAMPARRRRRQTRELNDDYFDDND